MAEHHVLMGGGGKNRRRTTKEESLSHAKEIAEDWYLELRGKARAGQLASEPTFKRAADQFLEEHETITNGQRSESWVKSYELSPTEGWRAAGENRFPEEENKNRPGQAEADRPCLPEQASRIAELHPCGDRPQKRPRWKPAHRVQSAPHLYLLPPHGGRRYLPDREKLPHQRRNDREILRRPYQDDLGRCSR
jgi:hypothetical protein